MPNIPTPIRAVLGLAATAVDEARKLPETLPQAVTTVPLMAVSSAMQASLKVQQHIAMLAARGDEVLSQLRGSSAEPPSWATFDDDSAAGAGSSAGEDAQPAKAAFDLIDYDNTGFAEGADEDQGKSRWDAVGAGGSEPDTAASSLDDMLPFPGAADGDFDVTATPPSDAGPTAPPPGLAEAVSAPDLPTATDDQDTAGPAAGAKKAPATKGSPAKAGGAKAGAAKSSLAKAGPAKTSPARSSLAKASPAEASPAKASPAKASPAKAAPGKAAPAKAAKRGGRRAPDHEPLEEAARKAKPSPTPNPATMAAEILQAHEAADDE